MKRSLTLLVLSILATFPKLHSECVLVPLSLEERVNASTLIVEASVVSKTCAWNSDKTMIHTVNSLMISKILKGSNVFNASSIDVVTLGGLIGDKAVKVEPELELEIGDIGIFMLVVKNGQWVSESGPQGFIKIDKHTAEATDVFNTYPAFTIQSKITAISGTTVINVNSNLTNVNISSKRAAPTITSISPSTINAGTSSILTIKGTNFNSIIDTSSVQFKNGDDGGLTFVKALKRDYVSWSDTMIRLTVRTKAGTGKIRVVIDGNGVANSTDTLKIPYSHLNVVSGDTIGYETQEIGMNSSNGITWRMNKRFFDSTGARGAFIRSLERWRCGTFINWDTLGTVSHSAIKSDGVNMCAWDTSSAMPSGVLAQCFSFWSGCFTPGLKWYVNELDIRFRLKPTTTTNWNYTTGNATSTQFHFESVAVHELGHGHQLGHVINSSVVMHYSIGNGQTKPSLSTNDINGGTYVITKSGTAICGKNSHTKLNSGNCAIVAPNANFTMSTSVSCVNQSVGFTDSSQGNISAYSWNFGTNATPATANTKGPHNVTYSAGGNKTVSLTITTLNGPLVKNKSILVQNDSKIIPNFAVLQAEKGKVTFTNTSNNPLNSIWYFGDGDSSALSNPIHNYLSGGTYNVKLVSGNTCNTDDTIKQIKLAYLNFGAKNNSACINEPIVYIDSSDNNVATWSWSFPGGTPNSANGKGPHSVSYASSGNKSANLTITVAGSNNQMFNRSNLVNIGTDTFSKADFIFGNYGKNIVGFENKSSGSNMTYKWYFGDGDSSSEANPIHTYTNANNKTVRLVVSGDCGTDDTTIQLRDFTGLQSVSHAYFCKIVPNPTNGTFVLKTDYKGLFPYGIYDIEGRLVQEGQSKEGQLIEIDELSSGIYLVKVNFDDKLVLLKLQIN